MRTALIALALVILAGTASAQMPNLSNKVEGLKPAVNMDLPKMMTEDTVLDATLVEEAGEFFLDVVVYLPQQYDPHGITVWVFEGQDKNGPWSKIVSIPHSIGVSVVGDNTVHIPLTKEPEPGYLRVALVKVEGSESHQPHAEKIYEVYCTGVQIRN